VLDRRLTVKSSAVLPLSASHQIVTVPLGVVIVRLSRFNSRSSRHRSTLIPPNQHARASVSQSRVEWRKRGRLMSALYHGQPCPLRSPPIELAAKPGQT
jgi:hypothetical protein